MHVIRKTRSEKEFKLDSEELLNYLLVAEPDFKEELCSKVCMAVETPSEISLDLSMSVVFAHHVWWCNRKTKGKLQC